LDFDIITTLDLDLKNINPFISAKDSK